MNSYAKLTNEQLDHELTRIASTAKSLVVSPLTRGVRATILSDTERELQALVDEWARRINARKAQVEAIQADLIRVVLGLAS